MKLNFTQLCVAGLFLCLLNVQPSNAGTAHNSNPATEEPARSGLFRKSKTRVSRNNHAVKIYPDPVRRAIHVVAKENKGKEIDFFVFDLQGTLVEHLKLDAGEHERLSDLGRGKYIYRVFAGEHESLSDLGGGQSMYPGSAGDEETASGDFEMR